MNKSKRNLAKALGIAGAGVPLQWQSPAVEAAVLPCHAQASSQLILPTDIAEPESSDSVVWVFDENVTSSESIDLCVSLAGGKGGEANSDSDEISSGLGGAGAVVNVVISVGPGDVLTYTAGEAGGDGTAGTGGEGGNGGNFYRHLQWRRHQQDINQMMFR